MVWQQTKTLHTVIMKPCICEGELYLVSSLAIQDGP